MIEEISTRAASEGTRRRPRWWLVTKNENGRVEFLTMFREEYGGEALPIFAYEEEDEMLLNLN